MSRNRKKTAAAGPVAEAASGEAVGAVKLSRSVKVGGVLRRAGSVLTDLAADHATEIVESGWGEWHPASMPQPSAPEAEGVQDDQTDPASSGADGEGSEASGGADPASGSKVETSETA